MVSSWQAAVSHRELSSIFVMTLGVGGGLKREGCE